MPKLSDEEIHELLTQRHHLRLATIGEDDLPSLVPLGFAYRDGTIYLTARERVEWLANIRRNPKVAASIDDTDYARKKLTIRGPARIVHEPGEDDEWRDLRLPLRDGSWPGPRKLADGREEWLWAEAYTEMTWNEPRALVAIALADARVTSWRMPYVGEPLDSAWSPRYFREEPRRFVVSELGPTRETWKVVTEKGP